MRSRRRNTGAAGPGGAGVGLSFTVWGAAGASDIVTDCTTATHVAQPRSAVSHLPGIVDCDVYPRPTTVSPITRRAALLKSPFAASDADRAVYVPTAPVRTDNNVVVTPGAAALD